MSKLVNCKACGNQIAKGTKHCPSCGKDNRNFFAKHKIITVLYLNVIIRFSLLKIFPNGNKRFKLPSKYIDFTVRECYNCRYDNKLYHRYFRSCKKTQKIIRAYPVWMRRNVQCWKPFFFRAWKRQRNSSHRKSNKLPPNSWNKHFFDKPRG